MRRARARERGEREREREREKARARARARESESECERVEEALTKALEGPRQYAALRRIYLQTLTNDTTTHPPTRTHAQTAT